MQQSLLDQLLADHARPIEFDLHPDAERPHRSAQLTLHDASLGEIVEPGERVALATDEAGDAKLC